MDVERLSSLTVLSLEKGDDVREKLTAFLQTNNCHGAVVLGALGSVVDVVVGNAATQTLPPEVRYTEIPGPFEVLSFCGEIRKEADGSWFVHIHMGGSRTDASAFGGGMRQARVFKGLKIFLQEI